MLKSTTKPTPKSLAPDAVLCFVSDRWAYFTTCPLHLQWGDKWDTRPYERIAGPPYQYADYDLVYQAQLLSRGRKPWKVTRVAFTGLKPPHGAGGCSGLSVEEINARKAPWLTNGDGKVTVWAGTTLGEFQDLVKKAGSSGVYIQPAGA